MNVLHRPAFERRPLPPEVIPRAVAVELPAAAPGAPVNLAKLEAELKRKPPLDEIAEKVRALTYGEMIQLAEGLWKLKPEGEITEAMLPGMFHKWSTGRCATG